VDFAKAAPSPPLSSGNMSGDVKPGVGLLSTVASQGNLSAGSTGTAYGGVEAGLVPLEGPLSMGMDPFEGYTHDGEFKPSIMPSPSQAQTWYQSATWGSYISQGVDTPSPSSFGLNSASPPLDQFAQGISVSSPPSASSPPRDVGTSGLLVYSPIPRQSLNTLRSSPPLFWSH